VLQGRKRVIYLLSAVSVSSFDLQHWNHICCRVETGVESFRETQCKSVLSAPNSKLHSVVDDVDVHNAMVLVHFIGVQLRLTAIVNTMKCRVCRVAVLSCVKQEKHSLRGLGYE